MSTLEKSMYGFDALLHGGNHAGGEHPAIDHNSEPPAGPDGPLALDTIDPPPHPRSLGDAEDSGTGRTSATDIQSGPASAHLNTFATGAVPQVAGAHYSNVAPYTSTTNLGKSPAIEAQCAESYHHLLPISAHASGSSSIHAHKASPMHTSVRSWVVNWHLPSTGWRSKLRFFYWGSAQYGSDCYSSYYNARSIRGDRSRGLRGFHDGTLVTFPRSELRFIMDPFEVRMQFLGHLRKLNASQTSIQKIVGYALKHFARCGEDLWDCVMEECQKGSLNTRMNILHLLDNLCETALLYQSGATTPSSQAPYIEYVTRDLEKIVEYVVPNSRDGLINFQSAKQILESWQTKRVLDPIAVSNVLEDLEAKKASLKEIPTTRSNTSAAERDEIFKRIEEDRERHKLLRQRRWNVPTRVGQPYAPRLASAVPTARILPLNPAPTSPVSPIMSSHLTSPTIPTHHLDPNPTVGVGPGGMPPPAPKHLPPRHALRKSYTEAQRERQRQRSRTGGEDAQETALDIEFEQAWETTSDWNEDDIDAVAEECGLCWGEGEWDIQAANAEDLPMSSGVEHSSSDAYPGGQSSVSFAERR
ncbi:CTD kinase subunit gamma CTK3 protein [Rhizoctonia solani AG-3 Rhs1AP]|uniref:CTD kinase subunit gamma CTK3 protein n=1 Tax=Rhizoctonia solani AG-3 Rhs1AP TaxID=1086054 RepID=X8J5G1_9AGAM|nr:CTD kinase subunit gamma CTK3 protein [Rhizoctonia solani AG-3 Rhs1AP]